jgi:predicted HAD superfamily Cof-like phosphohydrolase
MNSYQGMVRTFHHAFGATIGKAPALRDEELRAKLIEEEAAETAKALREGDIIETIDGLCDLLYVTFGAAVAMGIDLDPFFHEVHRSNMAKVGGTTREDGKVLKPYGWTPPDIKGILFRETAWGGDASQAEARHEELLWMGTNG